MSGARHVRFYPSDWRSGCIGLSIEEEGFYVRACAHFYETGKRLPNDDLEAASRMMMDVRMYRRLKNKLVEKGKLHEREDGYSVPRAERELRIARSAAGAEAAEGVDSTRHADGAEHENWRASMEGRSDIVPTSVTLQADFSETSPRLLGDFAETSPESLGDLCQNNVKNQSLFTEPEIEEEVKYPLPPKKGATPFEALKAFEAYNATALRCGLPQAAKLTPDRQRKIIARLKDYGLDGWSQAMTNLERSSFLTGGGKDGWRANLEFVLQASSFGKLHDGGYGNGRHAAPPQGQPPKLEAWQVPTRPRQLTSDEMEQLAIAEYERENAQCQ